MTVQDAVKAALVKRLELGGPPPYRQTDVNEVFARFLGDLVDCLHVRGSLTTKDIQGLTGHTPDNIEPSSWRSI